MVRTEVKISMKKKYSACLYFKLLKSSPNKYSYVFSAVYIFRQNIPGKNIRSASGIFIAGNPFVKNPGFPFLHFRLI
jgi:hypothetical protein